jgi:periplasmic protein TonB
MTLQIIMRMTRNMMFGKRLMNAPFVPEIAVRAVARSGYRPSRQTGPVAMVLSGGTVAALLSVFLFANVVMVRKVVNEPLVITLSQMPESPPPAAPEQPREQPQEIVVEPDVTAPQPMVLIPMPESPQMVAPPPPPVQAAAAPAPPAAPARSGPVEAGELSGNLVSATPPTYPFESRRMREQGIVVLAVLLSPGGTVDEISVARSSGHVRLDKAALKAVRHWRWSPFRRDGEQVAVRGQVTIPFVLQA